VSWFTYRKQGESGTLASGHVIHSAMRPNGCDMLGEADQMKGGHVRDSPVP
jgi:hypothetical protein